MIAICDPLSTSLEEESLVFQSEFPKYPKNDSLIPREIDVLSITGKVYSDSIYADTSDLLSRQEAVTSLTFDTYFKLNEINIFLKEKVPNVKQMDLSLLFSPSIAEWIDTAKQKIFDWIQKGLAQEKVWITSS